MAAQLKRVSQSIIPRLAELSRRTHHIGTNQPPRLTLKSYFPVCPGQKFFSLSTKPKEKKKVAIHFILDDGEKTLVNAKIGENLLDIIEEHGISITGFGACEGTLSCSTCHLIFKEADFDQIPEKATDEELDMLDLAYGLTETSRLACQVLVTEEMEGWEVRVPECTADART